MPPTRQSIIRGPGTVTYDSVQVFDRDGIDASLDISTFEVPTSMFGNVDTRRQDIIGKVSCTPCGAVSAGLLAMLYPYGNPTLGSSLGGAADKPISIHSLAGTKVTFVSGFLSAMPSLRLSARETLFGGAAEWTAILGNGLARTGVDPVVPFYSSASQAWAGTFDKADIKSKPISAAWGSTSPWAAISTTDGWTIDFEMGMEPVIEDGSGTIDFLLTSVTARARCRPIGITEAQVLAALNLQGATGGIGDSMRSANDLVLIGTGGLTVTLKEAALMEGPLRWGNTDLRAGELGFVAHRAFPAGVAGAIFSVALTT
jgi:hypothetical protein